MQFIFVGFWLTPEIIRYDVKHGHRHLVLGIEVKQTHCTFQFNKYFKVFRKKSCILRGRIDNASVAFLKSVSIIL